MPLTEREKQILEQVVVGRQTKEIAHELGFSPRTIETDRAKILHKMGARNTIVRKTLGRNQPRGLLANNSRHRGDVFKPRTAGLIREAAVFLPQRRRQSGTAGQVNSGGLWRTP